MEQALFIAPTDQERIARLEERIGLVHSLVAEIRQDQKAMADVIARASGGLRVLILVGGLAGMAGSVRAVAVWASGWLPHSN